MTASKGDSFWTSSSSRRALFLSTSIALAQVIFTTSLPDGFEDANQFIAAMGDPKASSGTISGSQQWGLWKEDPGPRGVTLDDYQSTIAKKDNVAPAGWNFDTDDWWLEEHGLIMESPAYPMPAGKYVVTGARTVTTVLTIDEPSKGGGGQKWSLEKGTLYDVTHLPCRSARYHPLANKKSGSCLPSAAHKSDFPVTPGAKMPEVDGCTDKDYAVIFLIGVEKEAAVST